MDTPTSSVKSRSKSLLALLTSFLVAVSGLFMVPTIAGAADGPALSVTEAPRAGGQVTVTGTGFSAEEPGVYLGLGPAGLPGFYQGSGSILETVWVGPNNEDGESSQGKTAKLNADGTFTVTFDVPAFSEGVEYALYTSKAHGQGFSDPSQNVIQPVAYEAAAAAQTTTALEASAASVEQGQTVSLTATVAPADAAGTVVFSDNGTPIGDAQTVQAGVASLTTAALDAGTHTFTAAFTPDDAVAFEGSSSNEAVVTVTEQTEEPGEAWLKVEPATELDPDGSTITISGGNLDTETNAAHGAPGTKAGIYVQIGWVTDGWQPSAGGESNVDRKGNYSKWVTNQSGTAYVTWENEQGDFSFDIDITEAKVLEGMPEGARPAVFTTVAGGAPANADYELVQYLDFADGTEEPEEWDGQIEVFLADGTTPYTGQPVYEGDELVVKGAGFDPEANTGALPASPIPADLPQGTFVVFGNFSENWQPSAGAPSSSRVMNPESRQWAVTDAVFGAMPNPESIADSRVTLETDGTFTATVTVHEPTGALPTGGKWGIYTYAGGVGTKNADQERSVEINYQGERPEEPQAGAGSLIWGVKDSFVKYIEGNIAHGKITMGDPAGRNGNLFLFPQAEGEEWDAESRTGSVPFAGSVNFYGHDGEIDTTLEGFVMEVLDANTAQLKVLFEGELVVLADVDLSKAAFTENADGSVTWTGAPAAVADGPGLRIFERYEAGEPMDPVTFTAGTASDGPVEVGPSVTVSSPKVKQGEKVTFTGTGFEPGAKVTATVRSNPVVLGTKTADAKGAVAFEWTVPANFMLGQHSIELAVGGEKLASNTFTVEAAQQDPGNSPQTPAETCVAQEVIGGSFNWGVKESFRNYLGGKIANGGYEGGSYTASGGAVNVNEGGIGRIDFSGSFHGWGHKGALDYTLSNPSIQITSQSTGILYVTVNGSRVAYANLSFSSLSVSSTGISGNASASLTSAGANTLLYNGRAMYEVGTQLDGFSFSASLGGEVPCSSETGTDPIALGNTGASGDASLAGMGIATMVMLLGAGLLLSVRRRSGAVSR